MASDERFDRIESKIEELKDSQTELKHGQLEMNGHIQVYNEQLKVHIAGTEENRVQIKDLSLRLQPIEDHVKFIRKLVAFVIGATTIAVAVTEILSYFK